MTIWIGVIVIHVCVLILCRLVLDIMADGFQTTS
jgi:hypothetical protein